MKGKRFIACFFIATMCLLRVAKAQDTLSSYDAEQKTLELYNSKNWKELTKLGNQALKKGYDYFYMQMRVGIAYYEQQNYLLAQPHFFKALQFNSTDTLAQEYLYYCYLFAGRNEDARKLSTKFGKELAVKTGTHTKPSVDFIMIEGGTKISDSSTYYKPAVYLQAGLSHTIKNKISFFHAFTYFNQKNFIGTLSQMQYYLKAAIPIKKNWLLSPSFHLVDINFSSPSVIDTLWPPNRPHVAPPFGAPPLRTTTSTQKTNSVYFVGSLAIQKIIKRFTLLAGSTVSNISNKTEFINNAAVYYSFFGNSKLVAGCNAYIHTIDNYATTYTSVLPFIYVQPVKCLSLKASYLYNVGNNIIEDNGYFVNNSPDLTKSRWAVLANFYLSKSLTLYATYQLEDKQEEKQKFNYHYTILVAGIKITPYIYRK